MGCSSSSSRGDDEYKPDTHQNSVAFRRVNLGKGERSSSNLKRQLARATTSPLAPWMRRNASLGQTLRLDESAHKAKGSRQRAADDRLSQNEALYTEKSFREFASMYKEAAASPPGVVEPEVVGPGGVVGPGVVEPLVSPLMAPLAGTLAWFMGADLELSSPVSVTCPSEEAAASQDQGD